MTNFEELTQKIIETDEIEMTFRYISDEDLQQIYSLLQRILQKKSKIYLCEYLFMMLKEVLVNSIRASAKREFFARNGLDPEKDDDYKTGIVRFKNEIILNWSAHASYLRYSQFFIVLRFKFSENIDIEIINNSPLVEYEKMRIDSRLSSADKYKNILDAYTDLSDSQESAGLGIVMIVLLLKSIGLDKSYFKIECVDSNTVTSIHIPAQIIPHEIASEIREKILKEVDMLPSLPKSLQKIMEMCNSENLEFSELALEIEKNPALSADLLKLSNSSSFVTRMPVNTILQAVKIVGSNNILKMLYAVSSYTLLKEKFPRMEKEWEHANKTSIFAVKIAEDFGLIDSIETISLGALLHDIGKILLLAVEGKLFQSIQELTKNLQMESNRALEEATIGISHSELGILLAKKWNYPEDLSALIEFHQDPFLAPEKYKRIVEIVYLANILSNKLETDVNFYSYDLAVLHSFNIYSIEDFNSFHYKLESHFRSNNKNPFFG
ncbi:MAG TPA: HDOD domain-containing protein [Leptospiraceae bacterium]|nr:HDOD domain-containing protein [Leptospiraceae bacterium]HNL75060.1 HDOD domain-containing protein [Leptospiraceae bacterium]